MNDDVFFADPSAKNALTIRSILYGSLKNQLVKLLPLVSEVIPNAIYLNGDINILNKECKWSPKIFAAYHIISNGIKEQNAGRVANGIAYLRKCFLEDTVYIKSLSLEAISSDFIDAEIISFLYGKEGPRTPEGGYPEIYPPSSNETKEYSNVLINTLSILGDLDNELRNEFETFVGELRHFRGRAARGMTSVRCFGRIYLRCPDHGRESDDPVLYYLDHITHELSHLLLHGMMNIDPLIMNDDSERYEAPIRPDPRPLFGIYHATFVLSRIVHVLGKGKEVNRAWKVPLENAYKKFSKGLQVLNTHADLTYNGKKLLNDCTRIAEIAMG
ncbi:MAG: HEXXH motif-containing putative peptide modification protein [Bacteroidota bacterium]